MVSRSQSAQPAGPTSSTLQIYLLGSPAVAWAGQPLAVPRRQARALLYRLAACLQPGPREHLCFLFWPDTPEAIAHRHLTCLLTHLRRALPSPELLLVADDSIGLDPLRAWSDVVEFARLCANLTLQQAVSLYRGPFLAGFSLPECPEFEAWSLQERYAQECLYLEALDALVEERAAQGAYAEAIAYARRYLASDELAEKVHRHLIELYAATGDRGAALRQYERCVTVLERELGVSPLPETQAAYQAVLRGKPVAKKPPPTWTTLPSLEAPLVGRDEALSRLADAHARARSGHGAAVLISGEPGIGKSRLVQEFVTGLRGEATVMVSSGHETEQGLPYWPLIEALSPHVPVLGQAALQLEPHYLAQVARILPELRTLHPNLPAPIPWTRARNMATCATPWSTGSRVWRSNTHLWSCAWTTCTGPTRRLCPG
jgi:DNA-binding SARP family transcriptional activator